ncbi:MAG: hypothetical protein ACLGPM_05215 [Acidobacteriota bacterium]
MKLSARYAAWLLPLLLTGCFHRHQQAQNVPVAPPLSPAPAPVQTAPVQLPPTATAIPAQPKPAPPPQVAEKPAPKPVRRPVRRRHHPAAPQTKNSTEEVAANGTPGVSAIGQLSSGDPIDERTDTSESILAIEKSLNGIHRSLSSSEQKTADHIREFLKQARQALASGDVDGAHTLAAKAKVLLDELTK